MSCVDKVSKRFGRVLALDAESLDEMRAWARVSLAVALALLVHACTPGPEQAADPVWGKQACSHCRMLVSEKAPAAQLTLADGTRHHFDDIGCMVAWVERQRASPKQMWVRLEEAWVPATSTRYRAGAQTPMDFGYLPAREGVGWDEVREAVRAKTSQRGGER